MLKNAGPGFGRLMRRCAGSCGITTVWQKRRKGTWNRGNCNDGREKSTKGDYQEQIDEAEEKGDSVKAGELRAELAEELEQMSKDIEEKGYASWEGFLAKWNEHLSSCLSPLRTADIGDMIVEVDSRQPDDDTPSLDRLSSH